jgi:N6-L-threonylcarbamoyladenine synthase
MSEPVILGLETSCDETSAAVLVGDRLEGHVILSQDVHEVFGGVVPELAARHHLQRVDRVVDRALEQAGRTLEDMDALAVTAGPGLIGALLVGLGWAKAAAYALDKPLVAVHHMEAHLFGAVLENPEAEPPFVALLVSGLALSGDSSGISLPRPMLSGSQRPGDDDYYDVSFSGLKTAVLLAVRKLEETGELGRRRADVAASFQEAVAEVLVAKTLRAVEQTGCSRVILGGGVSANRRLRQRMADALGDQGRVFWASPRLSLDNGAMVARAGRFHLQRGEVAPLNVNASANLPFPGLVRLDTPISVGGGA